MSQGNKGTLELDGAHFGLRSERREDGELILVGGEMDLSTSAMVDREVRRAEASDAENIVLDLDQLEFLDASGVQMLLDASARSKTDGDRLRITRASAPQVQRVIELTGVGDMLPFAD
jgi:anti-anti-sigma factor